MVNIHFMIEKPHKSFFHSANSGLNPSNFII